MAANPNYVELDHNPNEHFGTRACSFAGQQKSVDCAGKWRHYHTVRVHDRTAPYLVVCDAHRHADDPQPTATPRRSPAKRDPKPQVGEAIAL